MTRSGVGLQPQPSILPMCGCPFVLIGCEVHRDKELKALSGLGPHSGET